MMILDVKCSRNYYVNSKTKISLSLSDKTLRRLLDNVENSLEKFVLEHKSESKNWVGMESLLVTQYQSRLESVLQSKAYTKFIDLEPEQKVLVSNRVREFLVLANEEYDMN